MTRKWWLLAVVILGSTITANGMQGPEVGTLMREKLAHSQKILEAMVTSDWVGLEAHSRALEKITEDRRWRVFTYPSTRATAPPSSRPLMICTGRLSSGISSRRPRCTRR